MFFNSGIWSVRLQKLNLDFYFITLIINHELLILIIILTNKKILKLSSWALLKPNQYGFSQMVKIYYQENFEIIFSPRWRGSCFENSLYPIMLFPLAEPLVIYYLTIHLKTPEAIL